MSLQLDLAEALTSWHKRPASWAGTLIGSWPGFVSWA